MDHWSMNKTITRPLVIDERKRELPLFSLSGVLPIDQPLSVNTDCLVISQVTTNPVNEIPILLQSLLTEQQMRVLLPLLKWPLSCSHELLPTSLFCSWQQLLAGFFTTQGTAREEWLALVQKISELLERTQMQ